jgi:endonuclease/exonuclease/phosphatase (EEP) superfamily protein YafD
MLAVTTAIVALMGATIFGFAGAVWWPFDLFSHFRLQYVIALLLMLLLALLLKRWKLAALAFIGAGMNVALIAPLYFRTAPPATTGPTLKLMHLNAWGSRNRDPAALARYLEGEDFDLVFVQESKAALITHVLESGAGFAKINIDSSNPTDKVIVLVNQSRAAELEVISMMRLEWGRGCELRIAWQGQEVAILSPHLTIPGPSGNNAEREAECQSICDWVNAQTVPSIVIGDLNSTPWCKEFHSVLAGTELVDSQQGFGLQCSWPCRPPFALSWMFSIAIDHCLHSADFVTLDRRIGPYLGSDHLPLEIELVLRAKD